MTVALADRYRVERELGQGGMATVYLAADLRHDRQVALKVLRPDLAAVIGASRFLHEIKTTANLQHPHILALHDSGEVEGTVFYVMPFVDGESLRDRLLREKQLPVEEAVRTAVEVAGALEYAHQHKVIHRDIKPENILLQGGHALVADFGIALAAARSDSGTRMTETGMSLGTPHYMSPEQAMGEREITAKSDVYALGCVLYEMLTGEPPFTGPTAQAIVARVMTEEPRSLTLQRRTVPRHVEAAVHRALSKLPADRFATAAQFAEALLNPAAMPMTGAVAAATGARPSRLMVAAWVAGAGTVLALAAGFLAGRQTAPAPAPMLVRFTLNPPDSVISYGRCCGNELALAPDGNTLVFVGVKGSAGPLYRRSLGRLDAEVIPGTEGASVPFFSPDSRWVGFFQDGKLRKVSLAGGPPIPIATVTGVSEASWSEKDVIVFSEPPGRLVTVLSSGGQTHAVTSPDSGTRHYAPSFLPGGKAVLFTMRPLGGNLDAARIGSVELESGRIDTLGPGTRARYANGYLVYAGADNTLLAQPFDPGARKTTGPAVAILDRIAVHGNTTHEVTLSTTGGLAYEPQGLGGGTEVLRLIGPGSRVAIELPGRGTDNLEDAAFSRDGGRIALRLLSPGTTSPDLWILDRRQGTLDRLTVGGGLYAAWSRSGRSIAYATTDGLYVKAADGTGDARLILKGSGFAPGSWLPGDTSLVFFAGGRPKTASDIGLLTPGDSTPRWLVATEFREGHPQVSPDGRWLAYRSDRTGQFELYVQPMAGDGPRVQVSTEGGGSPRWSPDGRTLYFVTGAGNSIVAASLSFVPGFQVVGRKVVADELPIDLNVTNVNWDLHPNGKEFLYIDETGATGGARPLVWILDWTELVRAMSTAK